MPHVTSTAAWGRFNTQHASLATGTARTVGQRRRLLRPVPSPTRPPTPDELARQLLLSSLTPEQQATFFQNSYFDVVSNKGNVFRIYRGARGSAHNVYMLDEHGNRALNFCGHARERMPDDDNLLVQKLLIECDEDEFVRHANQHRVIAGYPLLVPA